MKVEVEDGLYRAQSGRLERLEIEEDGLKKIRVASEVFDQVREVQKQMRRVLNGRKPDLSLVAEALLVHAASQPGIEEEVKQYCAKVFAE